VSSASEKAPRARLSLCLIVRDEAALLPEFLARVGGIWDELCVVDTGSRDDSRRILVEAGATLVDEPWQEDFARARNRSLELASGEWVLYLDPDELVQDDFGPAVDALLRDPDAGAATLLMRNRLPHGHVRQTALLRLFRRDPQICFRHAIHEEVATAVEAYLGRTGRKLRHLRATVDHLGYTRTRAEEKNKKERDTAILLKCLAADPGDTYSWFKLLELARFWDDPALAADHAPACREALAAEAGNSLQKAPYGGELLALLASSLFPADPAAALRFLVDWQDGIRPSAAYWLRRAELSERVGDVAAARAGFDACLALADETADVQLATVRPEMGLARLHLSAGDLPAAFAHVERALAHNPRDPEALLCACALFPLVRREPVQVFAEQYLARHGPTPELAAALAEAAA